MSKTGLMGLAVVLMAAGVLIAVSASSWRDKLRGGPDVRVLHSVIDDTWTKQDWLHDYKLVERSGRIFDSKELDGKVHVVSFFFASCPGPCFKQNTALGRVHEDFAAQGVTFLSITCDPDNDTPLALNQYARRFKADRERWLFLTGDMLLIQRVAAEVYGVPLGKETHVESFLVFDKWGERRGKFHWNQPAEIAVMKKMLTDLLAETSPLEKQPDLPHAAMEEGHDDEPSPSRAALPPFPDAANPLKTNAGSGDKDE